METIGFLRVSKEKVNQVMRRLGLFYPLLHLMLPLYGLCCGGCLIAPHIPEVYFDKNLVLPAAKSHHSKVDCFPSLTFNLAPLQVTPLLENSSICRSSNFYCFIRCPSPLSCCTCPHLHLSLWALCS